MTTDDLKQALKRQKSRSKKDKLDVPSAATGPARHPAGKKTTAAGVAKGSQSHPGNQKKKPKNKGKKTARLDLGVSLDLNDNDDSVFSNHQEEVV